MSGYGECWDCGGVGCVWCATRERSERLSAVASKLAGTPLVVVASETVKLPKETHDERAARLFAGHFISAACAQSPCLPCDGHVVRDGLEQLCVCGCHKV